MKSAILPLFALLVLLALSSPAPAPVQKRSTPSTTTPVCTLTSGFTSIPATALPTYCANIVPTSAIDNDTVKGVCKDLTLIFARGTTENGNIGDIVGPQFVAALNSMLGFSRVAVQGVNNYSASIAGFEAGGSATGSQNMARLIAQTMQQCSKTELCVSGYSQGAKVADNAANRITQALTSINSVLLFGDPDDGEAFGKAPASKLTTDCHLGGDICLQGNFILPPHLDYCLDANQGGRFWDAQVWSEEVRNGMKVMYVERDFGYLYIGEQDRKGDP